MNNFSTRAKSVTPVTAAVQPDYVSIRNAIHSAIGGRGKPLPGFGMAWMAEVAVLSESGAMNLDVSQVRRIESICKTIAAATGGTVNLCKVQYVEGGDVANGYDVYAYLEGPTVADDSGYATVVQTCIAMGSVFVLKVGI